MSALIVHPGLNEDVLVMRSLFLLAGAAVLAGRLSYPAMSQGTPQTVGIMKVDPQQ